MGRLPEAIRVASATTICIVGLLSFAPHAIAQVNPGSPPFSAFDTHQVDSINLMNNNIFLNVPVRQKSGAFGFQYSLMANSYVMTGYVGSTLTWKPSLVYGTSTRGGTLPAWLGTANGTISKQVLPTAYSTFNQGATCPGTRTPTVEYMNWVIVLADGSEHPLPTSAYTDSKGCISLFFTATTIDGSGYTVKATKGSIGPVYDRSGTAIQPTSIRDGNGNSISVNTTSGVFTDTLGVTALTDSSTSPSESFTWTDVNGGSPALIETATSPLTLKTSFGCSGVAEENTTAPLLSQLTLADGRAMQFSYEGTPNSPGDYTGRLSQITLPQGGHVSYSYGGTNNGLYCTYQSVPKLTRVTSDGTTTYTLAYSLISGSNYEVTNTAVDNGGNNTVYTFTGFTSTGNAALPTAQVLTEVQRYRGSIAPANLLTTDVYCYNTAFSQCSFSSVPTATVTLPITSLIVMHQIQGMSNTSATETHYDRFGNVTYSAQYDFGSTSPTIATTITYGTWNGSQCVGIGNNINDKPCDVLTQATTNSVAESRYAYDSHGNLLTTYVWNGSAWLSNTTPNVYNTNGTISTSYDLASNATTYSYSSANYTSCGSCTSYPFPTSISRGGLTTSSTWNGLGGVKLTGTDANGNITTNGYANSSGIADPLWRAMSVTDPLNNTVWNTYPSTSSPNTVNSSFAFNSGNSIQNTTATIDGYGRKVNVQTAQSPSSANYDTRSRAYSWSGNYRELQATSACSATFGAQCSFASGSTTNLFDPLGHPISTTDANGGTTTYAYNQNDVSATLGPAPSDEHVKTVQTEVDGLGRTTSVCALQPSGGGTACGQVMGNSGILTSYSYSFGSGTSTVSAARGSQTHTTVSDALGRVVTRTTPEGGTVTNYYDTDPSGCWQNPANQTGFLTGVKNADGTYNCPGYDGLGRVIYVLGNNGAGYCKRFYYDNSNGYYGQGAPSGYPSSGTNTVGRMVEAETDNCIWNPKPTIITDEWFAYDKDGRMTDVWESTPHSGGFIHTTVGYNPNGTVSSLNGVGGYAYSFGVDGEGRPSTLSDGATTIINGTTYDPAGNVLSTAIGTSGDGDAYTYDSLEHMTSYTITANGQYMKGVPAWNANGSLGSLTITDTFRSAGAQTCNYSYDDVARLVSDNCGSVWSQTYAYGPSGTDPGGQYENLTKSGSKSWNPGYNLSNNQMIGSSYDSNGRVLYDGVNTYTWDVYGKLASAVAGNTQGTCGTTVGLVCYTYDAFGRQAENTNSYGSIMRIYSPLGLTGMTGTGWPQSWALFAIPGTRDRLEELIFNGAKTAIVYHGDWLGTEKISTYLLPSPGEYSETGTSPYGDIYDNYNMSHSTAFAGNEALSFAGLDDTPNRMYMEAAGRWLSPDPAGASWNAYAYPTNPNSNVDPSGLCAAKDPRVQRGLCEGYGNGGTGGFGSGDQGQWFEFYTSGPGYGSYSGFFGTVGADSNAGVAAQSSQLCFCVGDLNSGVLAQPLDLSALSSIFNVALVIPQLAPSNDPNAPAFLVSDPNNPVVVVNGVMTGGGYASGDLYRYTLENGQGDVMPNGIPVTEVVAAYPSNGNPYVYTSTQSTGDVPKAETGPGQIVDFLGVTYLQSYPNTSSNSSLTATQSYYVIWNGQQSGLTTVNSLWVNVVNGVATGNAKNLKP